MAHVSIAPNHADSHRVDSPGTPVADVLLRVAHEARLLSQKAAQLDAEISKAVTKADFSVRPGFQSADLLRQELDGLEQFITALVDTLDEDGRCAPCDATLNLTLRAQAMRLRANETCDSPPPNGASELWEG